MSDQTPKPKRQRKPKAQQAAEAAEKLAAAPPSEDAQPQPAEPEIVDGVFIMKITDPDTGELLPPRVIKNGNLGLLEVESLMKLGLKAFQEQMGFS